MSLSKRLIIVLVSLAVSACSVPDNWLNTVDDNVIIIKITTQPDAYTFLKLEQIILENAANGFVNATVFSKNENINAAHAIAVNLVNTYAIKSEVVVSDAIHNIQLQLNKYNPKACYVNQLDDFNWYKSSTREIREYNQSEICATSINDRQLRI
ncbi:hypothetical protein [Citrobacter braakii]|uniref:hypothetical protein n=1 Tax=Citrobacter braakii TaxID=57706 RepID=UPI00115C0FD8|nr:hypothetical protein [Citrobacter braakii]